MSRRRGYTLMELLVSMALAVMLMALIAQVFRTAGATRERLRSLHADAGALRAAFETIQRDLHSMVIPPDDSGLAFGLTTEGGTAGTNVLQFASIVGEPLLSNRVSSETTLIQYSVVEDPRTGRPGLWRTATGYPVPEGGSSTSQQDSVPTLLLPGVTAATYLFYSRDQQNWIESWDQQPGLPHAIRIDLALGGAGTGPDGKDEPVSQESWIISVPAASYATDAANAASEAAAGGTTGTGGATGGTR